MESKVDRSGFGAAKPDPHTPAVSHADIDVPSAMASHIGNLYAEEERRHRHERTEAMIQRAESQQEA